MLKYKTCYAKHKNVVGKIAIPFHIRLKPNDQLITQRPSKVPIHYRHMLKYKTCYATHKNVVGKIAILFHIRLKPNDQLITQRPSKVPIHYRHKLNALLKELEKHNSTKQIGSSAQDKPVYGTTYLNPLIILLSFLKVTLSNVY